jgi:glycosyltransferase involved in cell wall biosynthesis
MIKVAAFGFTFLKIAELVNQSEDIRIDVYLHNNDYEDYKSDIPKNRDWVHPAGDNVRSLTHLMRGRFWKRHKFVSDLYLLSDDAPLFAFPKRRFKTVFLPIGFDLTVQPFHKMLLKNSTTFRQKCRRYIISCFQKSRIKKVDEIWASPFPLFINSLGSIRKDILLRDFLPLPINYSAHTLSEDSQSPFPQINLLQNRFLVFFPGRLMITKSEQDLITGQTKGAEEALRGFLQFQEMTGCDAELLLIDNSFSPDKNKILDLIHSLGAEKLIKWVKSPSGSSRLSNSEMAFLYRECDVVLGDFGAGWFGQTALEAAHHGKPFITHINPSFMYQQFRFNPFLIAKSPDEICDQLIKLFESEDQQTHYSNEMKKWYRDYLSEDIVRDWFERKIREAVEIL